MKKPVSHRHVCFVEGPSLFSTGIGLVTYRSGKHTRASRFPNNDGLSFNHVCGKTLHDGSSNISAVHRYRNSDICPVKAIDLRV